MLIKQKTCTANPILNLLVLAKTSFCMAACTCSPVTPMLNTICAGGATPAPGAPRRCLGFGPWWQHASCPPRARLRCARAGRLTACTATSCTTCPGALSVKRCGGIPTCTATSCTKCPRWNIWNATTPIVVKRSLSGFQQKPGAQVDDHPVGQPEWCWVDELSMDQTWSNPWGEHSRLAKIYGCSSSPNIW